MSLSAPATAPGTGPRAPRFHDLVVADVRRETAEAVSVSFVIPESLVSAYQFTPGQYLTLRARIAGEELRRSYSICSVPEEGELRIAIKRVPGGVFSAFAQERLKPGDRLAVMTPAGRFGIAPAPGRARTHLALAAGSGITPILSILQAILAEEKESRVFLFYGNRRSADILFAEKLAELKDRYLDRFALYHILSQEEQDIAFLNGRLDGEKVRLLLRHIVPAAAVDEVFLCGPEGMSEAVLPALAASGLLPPRVHVERFASALHGRPRPPPVPPPAGTPAFARAVLVLDGKRREIAVAEGEAVLDAALRAGMDLPYACKGGMCSTCRARLIEGRAEMALNFALDAAEVASGAILTCQARPLTPYLVVDYDQA